MDSYKEYASKDFLEDQLNEKADTYLSLNGGTLNPLAGNLRFGDRNKLIFSTVQSVTSSLPSIPGEPSSGGSVTNYIHTDRFNLEVGAPDYTEFDSKIGFIPPLYAHNLKFSSLSDGQNIQFNAPLVMSRKQIHAVGDPIYDYDAATKAYVNNQLETYFSFGTEDLEVGKEAPENITGRIYICYEE